MEETLKKNTKSYTLIVKKELENIIRFLCNKLPSTEYSGTLFYRTTGSFETDDLKIYAEDFYLQDVGNATYTCFENDATLAKYMVDHNLMMHCQGLMHSHNKMAK